MKTFKTLRVLFVGASLLIAAGSLREARAFFSASNIETSVIVNVSTKTSTASTLVAATNSSSSVEVWCHQFANAGEYVLVRSASTGFELSTTTGTARINCAANNAASEHLILTDYVGPLYAITSSTYPVQVNVLRKQ